MTEEEIKIQLALNTLDIRDIKWMDLNNITDPELWEQLEQLWQSSPIDSFVKYLEKVTFDMAKSKWEKNFKQSQK